MAFGQSSGPPATQRQVRELLELLQQAGHADFRDARGPLGFTQRQANGKFTNDEAAGFISQLEAELDGAPPEVAPEQPPSKIAKATERTPTKRAAAAKGDAAAGPAKKKQPMTRAQVIREASDQALAAELQRRGWVVMEP